MKRATNTDAELREINRRAANQMIADGYCPQCLSRAPFMLGTGICADCQSQTENISAWRVRFRHIRWWVSRQWHAFLWRFNDKTDDIPF